MVLGNFPDTQEAYKAAIQQHGARNTDTVRRERERGKETERQRQKDRERELKT